MDYYILAKRLQSSEVSEYITYIFVDTKTNELVVYVKPQYIKNTLKFLYSNQKCKFTMLISICGVDYLGNINTINSPDTINNFNSDKRFEVVYNLLSIELNQRIRIKVAIDEDENIETASPIYNAATWYERELWDMYGIKFTNHPDMRRILTDYGFEGHPLRKDFPLTGYVEVYYDEKEKAVLYKPVNLEQEYRSFNFTNPWEGTEYILPGDEKVTNTTNNDSAKSKK